MNTDWVTVGVQAAEWDYGRGPRGNATITTVKKLTNTEVICATGNRYRRATLYAIGTGRGFLLQLNDPRVVNVLAHEQAEMLQTTIDRLLRGVGDDIEDVIAALDDIDKAVASTRTAIQHLTAPLG